MAALLKFRPWHGATTAAETIARLDRAVRATVDRSAIGRPTLVCRWTQGPDGRLTCHWEIEPPDIPISPRSIQSDVGDQG
jgi:hypothetical protein